MLISKYLVVSTRQFSNKRKTLSTVVITGCDTGLGYSFAQHVLKNGRSQVVAGCLDPTGAGAVKLAKLGAHVQHLDVTDVKTVDKLVETVSNNENDVNTVVNNAGVMVFGEFEWQTRSQIKQQIEVNLMGSLNVAHGFLPLLRKNQGRLVNVVSHCALAGLPGLSVYGATKAALLNWNDTLRIEQAKYGVKVISFIPGSFYHNSGIMAKQSQYAQEMKEQMNKDALAFHENYFGKVQNYLAQLPTPNGPITIEDVRLHDKMMEAAFGPRPKTGYKHEPTRYAIYHWLFKITPVTIRDRLVQLFVKLPKY